MDDDTAAILSFGLLVGALVFFQASFAWRRIADREVSKDNPDKAVLDEMAIREAARESRAAFIALGVLALIALAALWA